MKGLVRRPPWPAPAAKTATHSGPSRASSGAPPRVPASDWSRHAEPPIDRTNGITLAVLEEYSAESSKGYDPYNASASRRPVDVWKRKPRRG
jgi:hypothetical protein